MLPGTDSISNDKKNISVSEFVRLSEIGTKFLLVGVTEESRTAYSLMVQKGIGDKLTLWVEKKYNFFSLCGFPIASCEKVPEYNFDAVVVSGKRNIGYYKRLAESYNIAGIDTYMLYNDIGADSVTNCVPWNNIKYTDEVICDEELLLYDPHEFLSESRFDIVIRYMAGMEILSGARDIGVDMYIKLSASMNDFSEHVRPYTTCSYFSDYGGKKGEEEFIGSFRKLLLSMKENGFDKRHFVPLSESGGIINGTHRIAAALICGEKVYAKKYVGFGDPFLTFDENDFKRLDYSEKEIDSIKETYYKMKKGT
ncbi:MAG: hypothetical protein E7384_00240 [Ruminococcaceae bacterium]|nr:hypothetical protein [Oscillospiraceae bacterium]